MAYSSSFGAPAQKASTSPLTLAELLSALSFALDITEGARPGHSDRSCLLGMRIGRQIGLSDELLADLYYALLLKDIGCSSNSSRMAHAFEAEDHIVKQNFKLIDREKLGKPNREALTFAWTNIAPTASVWRKVRQLYRMVRAPGNLTADVIETRCERGAEILHKIGMGIETCAAVYSLDEHWNGQGLPDHLATNDIPMLGRICAVAQHLDLFGSEYGATKAMDALLERAGSWYDPDLVQAAQSLMTEGLLWNQCQPDGDAGVLQSAVLALDPDSAIPLGTHDIDLVCSGFADVIDAKSPFLYRHSAGTTEAAVLIANALMLEPERVDVVRRSALLHDIGMLSVPNTILDRRGPLTDAEWERIREHPIRTHQILSRGRAFGEIADAAGNHHERLDGSGYPFHLAGDQISLESRIVSVADVFTALMGSRPYRQEWNPAEIQQQLMQDVPHRLDSTCVEAVLSLLPQLADLAFSEVPGSSLDPLVEEERDMEVPPFRFAPTSR